MKPKENPMLSFFAYLNFCFLEFWLKEANQFPPNKTKGAVLNFRNSLDLYKGGTGKGISQCLHTSDCQQDRVILNTEIFGGASGQVVRVLGLDYRPVLRIILQDTFHSWKDRAELRMVPYFADNDSFTLKRGNCFAILQTSK